MTPSSTSSDRVRPCAFRGFHYCPDGKVGNKGFPSLISHLKRLHLPSDEHKGVLRKAISTDHGLYMAVNETLKVFNQWLCGKCMDLHDVSRVCHHLDGLVCFSKGSDEISGYIVGISKLSKKESRTEITKGLVFNVELLDHVFKVPITTVNCIPYGCRLAFSQALVKENKEKDKIATKPDLCYEFGNSLNDFFCYQCTCEFCGNGAHIPACSDDDDDYSAITPNEPVDSLSMGDEHLNTIPTTKSNEFIKSCVENLVPNSSESEGKNGCDMPSCFTTFSNILFKADYKSDSSDYQSCSDEDIPEEIFSNPLFEEEIIPTKIDQHHFNVKSDLIESMLNHDSSIIHSSSKIDSFLDEFAGELILLKSIPPGINETDCHPENEIHLIERLLYDNSSPRPPEEFVSKNSYAEIESFSPSPIPIEDSDYLMKEMNLSCTLNDPMPPSIEDDDNDSERDILILEELPSNYSLSIPEIESFYFDIPLFSRPPAKPPNSNTGILNIKMMGDVSDQEVPIPNLMITRVSNQEKSPDLLSHRGLENFQPSAKYPMMIHGKNILDVPLFHFYPLDQFKYGGTGSS
nr:reverse transcriptase domain-containing protein [Tanacetum cinerariifolium]